jgi:hypothetical protein
MAMLEDKVQHHRQPFLAFEQDGSTEKNKNSANSAILEHMFYRSKTTAWLTEQEEEHRFLVFEAKHEDSAWSKCCIRQVR